MVEDHTGGGAAWLAAMLGEHRLLRLPSTPAIRALPGFQRDAAVRIVDLLEREGGAVLADEVGLGKTHVAAAVLESRRDWRPALVVAPAGVLPEWRRVLDGLAGVELVSYGLLARRGTLPITPAVVVADEAHRLRNDGTRTYATVARLAACARLLLVSATPLHNRRRDVANLLALLAAEPVAAEQRSDTLLTLLRRYVVRRTRWTVEHVYPDEDRALSGRSLSFPRRRSRALASGLHPALEELVPRIPALATLALPDHPDGELGGLLASLLLQRLESSPAALLGTLRRLRNYLQRAREAAAAGERLARSAFRRIFGTSPEGQVAQLVLPFLFDGSDVSLPAARLAASIADIDAELERLAAIDWSDDPKAGALGTLLGNRSAGRTLVVTGYEETARYLFRRAEAGVALLTGSGAWGRPGGRLEAASLVRAFGPHPRGAAALLSDRYRTLVATDVLGEGVNLQGADRLVHYDRSWNPMATEQRAGRLDRLFSPHPEVEVVTFAVSSAVERHLAFERRLAHKGDVARETLGSDRIGVDRDGFLLALAARVARFLPAVGPPPGGAELIPVWIAAVIWNDRVDFVAVDVSLANPRAEWAGELLLRVAAGEGQVVAQAPETVVEVARRFVQTALEAERWADLEPAVDTRVRTARRDVAAPLLAKAAAAFRTGDRRAVNATGRVLNELGRRRAAALRVGVAGAPASSPPRTAGRLAPLRVLGWLRLGQG